MLGRNAVFCEKSLYFIIRKSGDNVETEPGTGCPYIEKKLIVRQESLAIHIDEDDCIRFKAFEFSARCEKKAFLSMSINVLTMAFFNEIDKGTLFLGFAGKNNYIVQGFISRNFLNYGRKVIGGIRFCFCKMNDRRIAFHCMRWRFGVAALSSFAIWKRRNRRFRNVLRVSTVSVK
jgi:hypothetical protein